MVMLLITLGDPKPPKAPQFLHFALPFIYSLWVNVETSNAESQQQFSIYALLSPEVTGSIFTNFVHYVKALVSLLMRAFTHDIHLFWNARAKSEGGQFRRLQKKLIS